MSQYQKLIKIKRIMDILFIDRSKGINKIIKLRHKILSTETHILHSTFIKTEHRVGVGEELERWLSSKE